MDAGLLVGRLPVPFRAAFECLWCGRAWQTRGPDDLEGWSQLCPDCLGKAGENGFLRFRLRAAIDERAGERAGTHAAGTPAPVAGDAARLDPEMVAYYEARAPEYDDWYLRRGRYDRGALDNVAWASELDAATMWLDGLPWGGRIVELAAGTGWWSPLLASRGELWAYDAAEAPLDLARERLVAHRLRAHLHVRDAWAEPDPTVAPADGLFAGFWLSHVERSALPEFLDLARRWLRPGGLLAFVDSRSDPASGAADHPPVTEGRAARIVADGREFSIPKLFHDPRDLEAALRGAGFEAAEVTATGRFFLLGRAVAAASD